MTRSRFLWKLYAGYALLILLATGLIGSLVAARIESETLADIDRRLRAEAMLLRDIAENGLTHPARLQKRALDLGTEIGTRLTIIRADGLVLADSEHEPSEMDDHGDRPEVLEARRSGMGKATRFSRTLQKTMRYFALPIEGEEGALLGYARASLPLTVLTQRLSQLRNAVLVSALVATVVALLLGFLHARRVTRPLFEMVEAAEAIAGGDYRSQVDIHSGDELGDLARAFNTMGATLESSLATVEADRNKLTAILSSMMEGVVAVDREERVVHMNRVAGRLLGVQQTKILGRPIWEVTRIPELLETLTETLRREGPVHRSVRLAGHPDRILDLNATPLEAGERGVAGAVLVIDDVTQLRRLETMRRDFFANVSHELKTPVTVIRGMVETLLDDPEAPATIRQRFLSKSRDQCDRLASLVTDLLSLSRLESGSGLGDLAPIDIREVVDASVAALIPTAERRRIDLVVQMPPQPVNIEGEEESLRQAVSNLVDNAIKYTHKGGSVRVRVRGDGAMAEIDVEDNGPGIEPRHLERIFERFYRVDKARSRELGGTGLGLAIVKHTARALNGDVTVESTPGRGSLFRIRIPQQGTATEEIRSALLAS